MVINMDYNSFPVGIALSELSQKTYGHLTEADKEKIILQCKDAKSKEEVTKIISKYQDIDELKTEE